jgi:hypothetical protein
MSHPIRSCLASLLLTALAAPALAAPPGGEVVVLRADGPIGPSERAALEALGARVLDAAPPRGYLVRLPASDPDRLTPALRAAGLRLEARPARTRLDPALVPLLSGQRQVEEPVMLRAAVLRDRTPEATAAAVRALLGPDGLLAAEIDDGGRGVVWLRAEPDALPGVLAALLAHPDVQWVERRPPMQLKNDNTSWLIQSGEESAGRSIWARGLTGFAQVAGVADSGLDADACQFRYSAAPEAVTPTINFPPPPTATTPMMENKVVAYYVIGRAEAYDDASGGFHGTHTAGNVLGDNHANLATATEAGHDPQDGMAPGAQLVFQDIGAHDGSLIGLDGVSMFNLLRQAHRTGARVHNNSYGSSIVSPGYDTDSASVDQAAWLMNDLLVVFAAGNSGDDGRGNLLESSLGGTGSTAKNSLVVGGSGPVELIVSGTVLRLQNDLLSFSSRGPTLDGRVKPDLVAPGMVSSATSDSATVLNLGCCDIYGRDKRASHNEDGNCNVDTGWGAIGTSFSSPVTAGAAVLARQYFTDGFWHAGVRDPAQGFSPSNALLKAVLINGAQALSGEIRGMGVQAPLSPPPSMAQGWGRVHLENALTFPGDTRVGLVLEDVPNPAPTNTLLTAEPPPFFARSGGLPLTTGEDRTFRLPPAAPSQPLRLTLVWSDPAAAPGVTFTLVNDLDLELIDPDGQRYLGNQGFDGRGFSQPDTGSGQADRLNNVESVFVETPAPGAYEVRVRAESVPGNGEAGSEAQGYALVATAAFLAPEVLSLSPATASRGETLEGVEVTGRHLEPGARLALGPGVAIEGFSVRSPTAARIDRLVVAEEAEPGPRAADIAGPYPPLAGRTEGAFTILAPTEDGGLDGGEDGDGGECPAGQHPETLEGQRVCAPDCRPGYRSVYAEGAWTCQGDGGGCACGQAGARGLDLGLPLGLGLAFALAWRRRRR